MSEDEPLEPITSETTSMPTEPVPNVPPVANPRWPGAPGAPPGGPANGGGSTVAVPKWILFVAGGLVVTVFAFAIGFAVGWAVAPGDDDNNRQGTFRVPRQLVPGQNGLGNGNGNDNGDGNGSDNNGNGGSDAPTVPTPSSRSAFLGVATSESTDPAGVTVEEVIPDSPASKAGLETDDVITKVDGDAVTSPAQLLARITAHDAGDQVTLTIVRNGDTQTNDVTLARRSSATPSTPSTTEPAN